MIINVRGADDAYSQGQLRKKCTMENGMKKH